MHTAARGRWTVRPKTCRLAGDLGGAGISLVKASMVIVGHCRATSDGPGRSNMDHA